MASLGAGLVVLLLVSESLYFISSPDSDAGGGVGDYLVMIEENSVQLGNGTEYVSDGETLTLEFNTDSIESWPNGTNVVALLVSLTSTEDESTQGLCPLGNDPEADTITGTIRHSLPDFPDWNLTGSNTNHQGSNGVQLEGDVLDISLLTLIVVTMALQSLPVDGYSKAEIRDSIDTDGGGLGDYFLDITVDVETGGSFQCEHTDEGEQVEYEIQLVIWDYDIERWTSPE